jgi:hypothetical protein
MGTLLTVMTFLLGFAAVRWRNDRDLRIKSATEEHARLLNRATKPKPMDALELRYRLLHLWFETIGRSLTEQRNKSANNNILPDALNYYRWDYTQKVALGSLIASAFLYVIGSISASWRLTWPPDPSWWAIMLILVGDLVVLRTSVRERRRHFSEINQEFYRLPLVSLHACETYAPDVVRHRGIEKIRLEAALQMEPTLEALARTHLPGDKSYWIKELDNALKMISYYPDIPWGRSLQGRYELWRYLHNRGPNGNEEAARYLRKARCELEEAATNDGDPIANIALVRVLELQEEGPESRRQDLIEGALSSIRDSPFGNFTAPSLVKSWFVPKSPQLRKQLESLDLLPSHELIEALPEAEFE